MNYTTVQLQHKQIIGFGVRTANTAADMGEKIGGLWQRLYANGVIEGISRKVGNNTYGIYTNYESDANGAYDAIAGVEVEAGSEPPAQMMCAVIPTGTYAVFDAVVDMQAGGMGKLWQEIWATDLNRAYVVDFEEYLPGEDGSKTSVRVYIGIAERRP